jgi:hypothetical protein
VQDGARPGSKKVGVRKKVACASCKERVQNKKKLCSSG